MSLLELFVLAVCLAMDAFSVSVCGSLALAPESRMRGALRFGIWFGFFQFLMPLIGFLAAFQARGYIEAYDHWIAFFLLNYIGITMIRESRDYSCEGIKPLDKYSNREMLLMAVATSIDALAVGVSFAFLAVDLWTSSIMIGVVTFALSFLGGMVGFRLGERFRGYAELVGGGVLCLIGLKILLEHLGYIAW